MRLKVASKEGRNKWREQRNEVYFLSKRRSFLGCVACEIAVKKP